MRILLVGALGRMGAKVLEAAAREGIPVAAQVDSGFGETRYAGEYRRIGEVREAADVILDFSWHGVSPEIAAYAASRRIPAVIATTGHTEEEREAILRAAADTPIFLSGNMSLGIAALRDAVRRVVSAFGQADVEIIETHHNRKLDAPSGTALMLFDTVREVRPDAVAVTGRSGKREAREVGISSVRCGNIVGIHEVRITTDSEQLTLKHEAFDRALFADGALKAASYLIGKEAGLYDMKSLMTDLS